MQLPQLYRRGVVRPLDDSAAWQLAQWTVQTPIRVEWLAVHGDDQFADIWATGILQRINDACGSAIGDYEEEELRVDQHSRALQAMRESPNSGDAAGSAFFESLGRLLQDAVQSASAVYFIF